MIRNLQEMDHEYQVIIELANTIDDKFRRLDLSTKEVNQITTYKHVPCNTYVKNRLERIAKLHVQMLTLQSEIKVLAQRITHSCESYLEAVGYGEPIQYAKDLLYLPVSESDFGTWRYHPYEGTMNSYIKELDKYTKDYGYNDKCMSTIDGMLEMSNRKIDDTLYQVNKKEGLREIARLLNSVEYKIASIYVDAQMYIKRLDNKFEGMMISCLAIKTDLDKYMLDIM